MKNYIPEGMQLFNSDSTSFEDRYNELKNAVNEKKIMFGEVIYVHPLVDYLEVNLNFGIRGIIPKSKFAEKREYVIAHNKVGCYVNFFVEDYDEENQIFLLNRVEVQKEAKKYQQKNFLTGRRIPTQIVEICDTGIIVDIGSGIENFIPATRLTPKFIRDLKTIFYKKQIIFVTINGYEDSHNCWELNYINCPQENGVRLGDVYALNLKEEKSNNYWTGTIKGNEVKGIAKLKEPFLNVGDTCKVIVVGFMHGIPYLNSI